VRLSRFGARLAGISRRRRRAAAAAPTLQAVHDDQCAALGVGTLFENTGPVVRHRTELPRRACEKPDPRYFAYAQGRFEGARGWRQVDNLHVAQSQYHDIGVATGLGIATAWIERRHGQKGSGGTLESEHTRPTYHFHTLAELADAVDAGRVS
jgi:hypothetical protein